MASGVTSFNSYTFTYEWTIYDLEARLHNPKDVESPVFSSPKGAQPVTKWTLAILSGNNYCSRKSVPIDHQHLSIELRRHRAFNSTSRATASQVTSDSSQEQSQQQDENSVWVEASLKPNITIITKKHSKLFQHTVPVSKCTSRIQRPRKVSLRPKHIDYDNSNAILFHQYLETSKVCGSEGIIFKCELEIKVWSLDKPVHVGKDPSPLSAPSTIKSDFNLGVHMEEARQNDLFTDVTLVADGKEFKAHKVVLASQSQDTFCQSVVYRPVALPCDRVEMTDIPAVIMEAILSYMYTGKIEDIEKIAYKLLPFAEEYGLIDLRKMCEEVLTRLLT